MGTCRTAEGEIKMICDTCIYSGRPTYKSPCSECNMEEGTTICKYEPVPHTPTNADRIRAMNDEELAAFITGVEKWLRQPVEEV